MADGREGGTWGWLMADSCFGAEAFGAPRYHLLHPEYIYHRFAQLHRQYTVNPNDRLRLLFSFFF